MGVSVLHIKSEIECRVFLFDEEIGIAQPDKYFNIEVLKGEQDFLFVSTEQDDLRYNLLYTVEENDCNYRLIVSRSQFSQSDSTFENNLRKAEQGNAEAQYLVGKKHYDDKNYEEGVKWIRWAAEQGVADAQRYLGVCYGNGQGVEQDDAEAVKWFRKAAEQGAAKAQYDLGVCYNYGLGVEQDYAEAVKWYRKAAEKGDADAQSNLGVCYVNGSGVEQDYAEAVKWYLKAAEQGDADAQYNLGVCYDNGSGVEQDYAEAVKWFRTAAKQDNADAQYNLGVSYYNGSGVEQDYAEAVNWWIKAAEQDITVAQYNLGVSYYNGSGVEQDYAEAVKWFRKAAEKGDAGAQNNLGVCYDNGSGVEQDYAEAVNWWIKAAEQDITVAQYNLGVRLNNSKEAVKWLLKAAEHGYADAQYRLGQHFIEGDGVVQDYEDALKWYRKAAVQGNINAQIKLGFLYMNGRGVKQDNEEALMWFRKAADQGSTNARTQIQRIRDETFTNIQPLSMQMMINDAEKRLSDEGLNEWDDYKQYIKRNGRGKITNDIEACCYLAAYGESHMKKLNLLFKSYINRLKLDDEDFEVFDYGCGQGLATISMMEHLTFEKFARLKKITLIDYSPFILELAKEYVRRVYETIRKKYDLNSDCIIVSVEAYMPSIKRDFLHPPIEYPSVVHLFSNILDIPTIDLEKLSQSIMHSGDETSTVHYVLATHPGTTKIDHEGERMSSFFNKLPNSEVDDSSEGVTIGGKEWCHLIGYAQF